MAKKSKEVRTRDDNLDTPRANIEDLYKHFEVTEDCLNNTMIIKNKIPGLFYKHVNADPTHIDAAIRQGYVDVEDVECHISDSIKGEYTGTKGTNVKIMVCLEKHRNQRIKLQEKRDLDKNKAIFARELENPKNGELPICGDRKESGIDPPPTYVAETD